MMRRQPPLVNEAAAAAATSSSSTPPTSSRRPSIKESTPTPRSMATLQPVDPSQSLLLTTQQSQVPHPYPYPYPVGRFSPFRSLAAATVTTTKEKPLYSDPSSSRTLLTAEDADESSVSSSLCVLEQQQQQQERTRNSNASSDDDSWWSRKNRGVAYSDLPPLPVYAPRCRSSFVVHLQLSIVLDRIATFLRFQSITCDARGLVPDGTLRCVTPLHCHFCVLLWRHDQDDHGEEQRHVIVIAIERRQGCCVELQRLRQALKKAIETGRCEPPLPHSEGGRSCKFQLKKLSIGPLIKKLYYRQQQVQEQEQDQGQEQVASQAVRSRTARRRSSLDGISTCSSLLSSPCSYKQQLGLESLVALTDPTGVDVETALDVADALLVQDVDGDEDDVTQSLQAEFISFFADLEEKLCDEEGGHLDDFTEAKTHAVRHSLALDALCNALQVTLSNYDDSSIHHRKKLDLSCDFWKIVIPALVLDVTHSASRPQDAALSAKCLAMLHDLHRRSSSSCRRRTAVGEEEATAAADMQPHHHHHPDCGLCSHINTETLLPYLLRAQSYGARHHLLLEREASHLIACLNNQEQQQSSSSSSS